MYIFNGKCRRFRHTLALLHHSVRSFHFIRDADLSVLQCT